MLKLFFNQKLLHFFCQNVQSYASLPPPGSTLLFLQIYTVYCIPYMVYTVRKRNLKWRNEVDTKK